jgi:hypothetical protein
MKSSYVIPLLRPVRKDHGFALITAMLAIGLLGALSVAIMIILGSINSQAQNMSSVAGARALITTLQGAISYPTLCATSLDSTTKIYNNSLAASTLGLPLGFNLGAQKVIAGKELLPYDVKTEYLNFRSNLPPIGADPLVPGNQLRTGQLFLKLSKLGGGKAAGGSEMRERVVGTLILSVNASTNAIARCYALVDAEQACKELNGNYDPGGTPKCKLPFPCAGIPNSIFMGYNASNVPQCKTISQIVGSTCPLGQYLVSNGMGGASCQAPP